MTKTLAALAAATIMATAIVATPAAAGCPEPRTPENPYGEKYRRIECQITNALRAANMRLVDHRHDRYVFNAVLDDDGEGKTVNTMYRFRSLLDCLRARILVQRIYGTKIEECR